MSKENKGRKARRLRISLVDDNTHSQLWVLRGKQSRFIFMAVTALITLLLVTFLVIAHTPLRTFIPGYPDAHQRRAASMNAMTIDSLETVVARWEFYSQNLRAVLEGGEAVSIDSLMKRKDDQDRATVEGLDRSDSLLRANVEEAGKFGLQSGDRKLPIEGMHFYPPVKGVISAGFETLVHPYVEVSAPGNAVIMAIADGTLMNYSWSDGNKYTMFIQHNGDLVSVIKGAGKVVVDQGSKVKAGAPVGMMQSAASPGDAQILAIELWYKGEAVDPAAYIKF